MIKVDIISGFLGAGKTTFIKKLVQEVYQGEKVVLIENEFGEVGIDGGFLQDSGIEISQLNSGCICCSLVGDFEKNLKEVIEKYQPERIIIEPSGVGKLSDVKKSVESVNDQEHPILQVASLITIVNGKKALKQMKAFGEFFDNQIEHATTLVISRTQLLTEEELEECVQGIKKFNHEGKIITTPWDLLGKEAVLAAIEHKEILSHEHHHEHHHHEHGEECGCHHEHHHHEHGEECGCHHEHHHEHGEGCGCHHEHHEHHHADEVFTSYGVETPNKYKKEDLDALLQSFVSGNDYGEILRAKGILEVEQGAWIEFDMVDGEYEIREGKADYTGRICVIGKDLQEKKLNEAFAIKE